MTDLSRLQPEEVRIDLFLDEKAERWVSHNVPQIRSTYLIREMLETHEVEGKPTRMIDLLNLVITGTFASRTPVGFVAAQVDEDQQVAVFHMLYVVENMRRRGAAEILIAAFEKVIDQLNVNRIKVAVTNRVSLKLVKEMEARKPNLEFEIVLARNMRDGVEI